MLNQQRYSCFCNNFFLPRIFPFLNPISHRNFLTTKIPTIYEPILVTLSGTLLKMELHYSQSSRENETPSSGTSPLVGGTLEGGGGGGWVYGAMASIPSMLTRFFPGDDESYLFSVWCRESLQEIALTNHIGHK